MVLINTINLDGLKSEFINNLDGEDYDLNFNESIIDDFNKRLINPTNINEIIRICDFLNIHDTLNFIIKNSTPTLSNYQLDECNKKNIKLPKFMTKINEKHCSIPMEIASYGLLNWLKFVHSKKYPWNEHTCSKAVECGSIECLKYAHKKGCPWNKNICNKAAEKGHLNCLIYLRNNGCEWCSKTIDNSIKGGHFECLIYLHENGCSWNTESCKLAAEYNRLDMLKYLHINGCPWNVSTCNIASKKGNIECLKYAVTNDCYCNAETYYFALMYNNKECIKYLYENILNWSKDNLSYSWQLSACLWAVENNNLNYFKIARNNGAIFQEYDIFNLVIEKGNINFLKYLMVNNTFNNYDFTLCKTAAEFGQLECLKYLHNNECLWDIETCNIASENGNIECIKYAFENQCPINAETYYYALKNNNLECIKYLYHNRIYWSEEYFSQFWKSHACFWAVKNNNIDYLKISYKYGANLNKKLYELSKNKGYFECAKFISTVI